MSTQKTEGAVNVYTAHFAGKIIARRPITFSDVDSAKNSTYKNHLKLPVMMEYGRERYYLKGRGIKGRYRHIFADSIQHALLAKDRKLTLEGRRWISQGGKVEEGEMKFDILQERPVLIAAHPYIRLFGAGRPWIPGQLQVEEAVAIGVMVKTVKDDESLEEKVKISEVKPQIVQDDDIDSDETMESITTGVDTIVSQRVDEIQRGEIDPSLLLDQQSYLDEIKSFAPKRTARHDKRNRKNGDDAPATPAYTGDTVPSNMPYSREVLPRGTVFSHEMWIEGCEDITLSIMLWTLDEFAKKPYLGAKVSANYGGVDVEYDLELLDANHKVVKTGKIVILYSTRKMECDQWIQDLIDKWATKISNYTYEPKVVAAQQEEAA